MFLVNYQFPGRKLPEHLKCDTVNYSDANYLVCKCRYGVTEWSAAIIPHRYVLNVFNDIKCPDITE